MTKAAILVAMLAVAAASSPQPVQRQTVRTRAESQFDRADTNHDGFLSHVEYVRVITLAASHAGATPTAKGWEIAEAQWNAVDTQHAGRVPRAVFVAAALAHFDGADLDHDGTVTPEEARKAARIKQKALKDAAPKS